MNETYKLTDEEIEFLDSKVRYARVIDKVQNLDLGLYLDQSYNKAFSYTKLSSEASELASAAADLGLIHSDFGSRKKEDELYGHLLEEVADTIVVLGLVGINLTANNMFIEATKCYKKIRMMRDLYLEYMRSDGQSTYCDLLDNSRSFLKLKLDYAQLMERAFYDKSTDEDDINLNNSAKTEFWKSVKRMINLCMEFDVKYNVDTGKELMEEHDE